MKLRDAATLAAIGWYLMVPPLNAPRQPLGAWHILKVYDSAKRCQDERDQFVFEAQKKKKTDYTLTYETKSGGVEYLDATAAQCIASDDPRLKSN
jgi:hypothetical protein